MPALTFDGHNDSLSRLWVGARESGFDPVAEFARDVGHVNTPAARSGGLSGGFFALYSPSRRAPFDHSKMAGLPYDTPLPAALDAGAALQSVIGQAGIAHNLQNAGHLTLCTSAMELAETFVSDRLAAILHLEGADCIDPDLLALDTLYALGLRSLGPVWSRPTIFGDGVPFQFGRDGDTGPGLTADGMRLIERCRALGVMVDTSHLTMAGFWQIAEAGLPLVATHSNAYAHCPATRNLTDAQLRAIGETGGMVGLNFGTIFMDQAGWDTGRATLDVAMRHLDHMIALAGEDHVGIGSDFDGAPMPDGIKSAADLPALQDAMQNHGYGPELIAKICHENWLSFCADALGHEATV